MENADDLSRSKFHANMENNPDGGGGRGDDDDDDDNTIAGIMSFLLSCILVGAEQPC